MLGRRARPDSPGPGGNDAEGGPTRPSGEWRSVAAVEPAVGPMPTVIGTDSFHASLTSHAPPRPFLAPLSHAVSTEAPPGIVRGLAHSVERRPVQRLVEGELVSRGRRGGARTAWRTLFRSSRSSRPTLVNGAEEDWNGPDGVPGDGPGEGPSRGTDGWPDAAQASMPAAVGDDVPSEAPDAGFVEEPGKPVVPVAEPAPSAAPVANAAGSVARVAEPASPAFRVADVAKPVAPAVHRSVEPPRAAGRKVKPREAERMDTPSLSATMPTLPPVPGPMPVVERVPVPMPVVESVLAAMPVVEPVLAAMPVAEPPEAVPQGPEPTRPEPPVVGSSEPVATVTHPVQRAVRPLAPPTPAHPANQPVPSDSAPALPALPALPVVQPWLAVAPVSGLPRPPGSPVEPTRPLLSALAPGPPVFPGAEPAPPAVAAPDPVPPVAQAHPPRQHVLSVVQSAPPATEPRLPGPAVPEPTGSGPDVAAQVQPEVPEPELRRPALSEAEPTRPARSEVAATRPVLSEAVTSIGVLPVAESAPAVAAHRPEPVAVARQEGVGFPVAQRTRMSKAPPVALPPLVLRAVPGGRTTVDGLREEPWAPAPEASPTFEADPASPPPEPQVEAPILAATPGEMRAGSPALQSELPLQRAEADFTPQRAVADFTPQPPAADPSVPPAMRYAATETRTAPSERPRRLGLGAPLPGPRVARAVEPQLPEQPAVTTSAAPLGMQVPAPPLGMQVPAPPLGMQVPAPPLGIQRQRFVPAELERAATAGPELPAAGGHTTIDLLGARPLGASLAPSLESGGKLGRFSLHTKENAPDLGQVGPLPAGGPVPAGPMPQPMAALQRRIAPGPAATFVDLSVYSAENRTQFAAPSVQRVEDGPAPGSTTASTSPGAAPSAAPLASHEVAHEPAAASVPPDIDELARRLYPRLRPYLKRELWLDRERAGLLADQI